MGDILNTLQGAKPDPNMKLEDLAYTSPEGKKGLGVLGSVTLVDSTGAEIDTDLIGGGASGGAGGGSIVYTNAAGDFTATVTAGTGNITIAGLPFILEDINVLGGSISKLSATGVITPLVPTGITVAGGVITLAGIDNFVATDKVLVTLIGPDKAYDKSLDIQKSVVQNPEYAHTTSVETLVSETNVGQTAAADADGDATHIEKDSAGWSNAVVAIGYTAYNITDGTSATIASCDTDTIVTGAGVATWASKTYAIPVVKRFEIPMDTYNFLTIHYKLTSGASNKTYMKIYGTLNSAATADDDTNWVNMSDALLGAASGLEVLAGTSLEDILILDTPATMLKYMIKIVGEPSVAAISNAFTVFIKKSS